MLLSEQPDRSRRRGNIRTYNQPLLSPADDVDGNGAKEWAISSQTASWKTVAIVMAILCGMFVVISALLALKLAKKLCLNRKQPQKLGNNNLQHNYNPLSTHGPKSDDFSDRIPVYNTRTNNV